MATISLCITGRTDAPGDMELIGRILAPVRQVELSAPVIRTPTEPPARQQISGTSCLEAVAEAVAKRRVAARQGFIGVSEFGERKGISPGAVRARVQRGKLPRPTQRRGRDRGWLVQDIAAHLPAKEGAK